ncbi:Phosphorylase b kinase gamma catalytic chain [Durusdinium trenchii]|uniref:Liver/testis isoform (PHK-gamma-LT) (PHK-gamma-T) (Phosphorylase kinase subunit gamma-2) n=1 Tax=Durusdinium trenchii TaxID=1381693 RepID=A0ABP0P2R9_9DINO
MDRIFQVPGAFEAEDEAPRSMGGLIALQLYSDGDLFAKVQQGALKEPDAVEITLGLLSALAYVHHLGIVHRDVKCENILLDGQRAVLADFGISCYLADAENLKKRVGSPGYAAPEMLWLGLSRTPRKWTSSPLALFCISRSPVRCHLPIAVWHACWHAPYDVKYTGQRRSLNSAPEASSN